MPKKNNFFQDRVIGHEDVEVGQLLAHPHNFKIHNALQQSIVGKSLDEIGWLRRILVNRNTGFVLDGHLRVSLVFREHGEEGKVPVDYVDLTEEEEAYLLVMLDESTNMAFVDTMKRTTLLDALADRSLPLASILEKAAHSRHSIMFGAPVDPEKKEKLLSQIEGVTESILYSESKEGKANAALPDEQEYFETYFVLPPDTQKEFRELSLKITSAMEVDDLSDAVYAVLKEWYKKNVKQKK